MTTESSQPSPAPPPSPVQPAPVGNDLAPAALALGIVSLVLALAAAPVSFLGVLVGAGAVTVGAAAASRSGRRSGAGRAPAIVGIVTGGVAVVLPLLFLGLWPGVPGFRPPSGMLHESRSATVGMAAERGMMAPLPEDTGIVGSGDGVLRVGPERYALALDSCALGGLRDTVSAARGTATAESGETFDLALIGERFEPGFTAIVLVNTTTRVLRPDGVYGGGASMSGPEVEVEFEATMREMLSDELVEVSLTVRCRE